MEDLPRRIKTYEEEMYNMTTMTYYDEWMNHSQKALNIMHTAYALIKEQRPMPCVVGVAISDESYK